MGTSSAKGSSGAKRKSPPPSKARQAAAVRDETVRRARAVRAAALALAVVIAFSLAYSLWSRTPRPEDLTGGRYVSVRAALPLDNLPAARRAATAALTEWVTRVRTGLPTTAPTFGEEYERTRYGMLLVMLAVALAAIPLIAGGDSVWPYLSMGLVYHVVTFPLLVMPPPPTRPFVWTRFTDYPALITSACVFGLVGVYYLAPPEEFDWRRSWPWAAGIAAATAFAAFVRENVLMGIVLSGALLLLEAADFIVAAYRSSRAHGRRIEPARLMRGALKHRVSRAAVIFAAVLVGIGAGQLVQLAVFPEILKLKWQVLPGQTVGGLWNDGLYYRPQNIARRAEIWLRLRETYGLFMFLAVAAPFAVRKLRSRFLLIAVALTFVAHFLSYYLFGGLVHEFPGMAVLIAGIAVPFAVGLRDGLPAPIGRFASLPGDAERG